MPSPCVATLLHVTLGAQLKNGKHHSDGGALGTTGEAFGSSYVTGSFVVPPTPLFNFRLTRGSERDASACMRRHQASALTLVR